jgi:hypothetical protein
VLRARQILFERTASTPPADSEPDGHNRSPDGESDGSAEAAAPASPDDVHAPRGVAPPIWLSARRGAVMCVVADPGVAVESARVASRDHEGWAAGLRLAALSLARDPDPEHLAERLSGRERTVAEYLLAEVLERQPQEVSQLLLRTSILERVFADLLALALRRTAPQELPAVHTIAAEWLAEHGYPVEAIRHAPGGR